MLVPSIIHRLALHAGKTRKTFPVLQKCVGFLAEQQTNPIPCKGYFSLALQFAILKASHVVLKVYTDTRILHHMSFLRISVALEIALLASSLSSPPTIRQTHQFQAGRTPKQPKQIPSCVARFQPPAKIATHRPAATRHIPPTPSKPPRRSTSCDRDCSCGKDLAAWIGNVNVALVHTSICTCSLRKHRC